MKNMSMLVWFTQLGLSVVLPPVGFILFAVWLQDAFGWGSWVPRYTINKIKKILHSRFFKIFLIVYSRIGHAHRWHSARSSRPE